MSGTDAIWSLRLLDHFSLRSSDGDAGLTSRKAVALVIFLALQRDRMARRDAVANLLWSGVDTAQGRVNLRQAIAAIRRVENGTPILVTEADTIALATTMSIDVERFAALAGGDLADRTAAADLYRTDLVTGFGLRDEPGFNEWLTVAQAHWRQRAVDVLLSLTEAALADRADVNAGVTAALKLLAIDPFNEAGHRTLMRLYVRQGRSALALAQYRSLADLLRRELQIAPDAETQALYEQVRGGRRQLPAVTDRPALAPPPSATTYDIDIPHPDIAPAPGSAGVAFVTRRWRMLALAGVAVVALTGSYAAWRFAEGVSDQTPVIARVYPIATADDDERLPALSPDGTLVVYGSRKSGNVDLYLATPDGSSEPVRLTDNPAIDTEAAWRPDGREIAFVRYTPDSDRPCTILVRPIPIGAERQVGHCLTSYTTSLSWAADGKTLYFDDDQTKDTARRIFALQVDDGRVRPLTPLSADGHGDYTPVVSHDGTRIAFQRHRTSSSDLIVRDLASGATTIVRRNVVGLYRVAWSTDDAGLFYTVSRGADAGLWWTSSHADAAPARLSAGLTRYAALSTSKTGKQLAVQVSQDRGTVFRRSLAGGAHAGLPGLNGGGFDRLIVQARGGRIAFASTRTGAEQLWIMRPGQGPSPLPGTSGIAFGWLAWAPNGRVLAAAATIEGRSRILLIDTGTGRIKRIPSTAAIDSYPSWSGDGRHLYWSSPRNAGSALMRMTMARPDTIAAVLRGEFGLSRFSADGRYVYYTDTGRSGIFRRALDAGGKPVGAEGVVVPGFAPGASEEWALTDGAIVYPRRNAAGLIELCRLDLMSGATIILEVAPDDRSTLSATPAADGGLLIVRTTRQNDISGMDFD